MSDAHPHAITGRVASLPPTRTGQPWTEEDHAQLVGLIRDGADEETIAEDLHRSAAAVTARLRRLLPVAERHCPRDRVLPAMRHHLNDPAYDWTRTILLSEPPAPIQHPPAIVREGVAGLEHTDLVSVGYGLLCVYQGNDQHLLRRVAAEITGRGLTHRVVRRRVDHLLDRSSETALTEPDALEIAWRWVQEAPGWRPVEQDPCSWTSGGAGASGQDEGSRWWQPQPLR